MQKYFSTYQCVISNSALSLIEKGSYENMESQELLNKQELKHQHKLPCLNKGDEIRFSRDCYSIRDEVDIQSCNYDRQAILGGRCNTWSLHKIVLNYLLQIKKEKASPKPMVKMKKALKLEG